MTGDQQDESSRLTPTRRHALKLAAGTTAAMAFDTAPVTAQKQERQKWAFETGNRVFSSPTVVDGTAFVGSEDDNLYAVDATTGEQEWAFETGNSVDSSPTVVDGTAFVGSFDDNLYAVDAATGKQQWVFETEHIFVSSPTVADGTVFVGNQGANLYAVDAATGEQQWVFETRDSIQTSPTVVDGTVFVGNGYNDDNDLYAVDAATGDQEWAFETGDYAGIQSSPTAVDGTVFVGSLGQTLYAVDAATGDQEWAFETGGSSSPTVVDGMVFVGSLDDNLYAVDAATGDQEWAFETGEKILSSPTVVDGTVFIGSNDNNLYAVDAATGDQEWAFETGNSVDSSPTVVDGTVFVGSDDNNLYAVDAGVEGSSEGSRVNLGTLGHHHVWADEAGEDEPRLFNLTVDAPSEAVAGSEVTVSVDAQANQSQISAFQIAPAEQPDHVNDFGELSVTTTAETQVADPGFVVYSALQDQVTVEWTGSIPETAEAGETFTLAGDALNEAQDRQLFSHTVTVTDDPLEKYRNDNGEIDDTGLLEAISDWRDGNLEDTQLLELISEWRDAGGSVEALPTSSLPNVN